MRERPILFSAPIVRAILAGQKTQTRRIIMPQPERIGGSTILQWKDGLFQPERLRSNSSLLKHCPYGQPGTRLYVREAWRTLDYLDRYSGAEISEKCLDAGYSRPWAPIHYEADGYRRDWIHVGTPPHSEPPRPGRYRHARFMPRWASRITLEITGVRVERPQDISNADCKAEGLEPDHSDVFPYAKAYRTLCEQINGPGSWEAIPGSGSSSSREWAHPR